MKRLLLLLLCLFTMGTAWSRDTLRLDLSQPTIPTVLEFDPEKGHWVGTYDEQEQLQFNGVFNMGRMSDSYGGFYWEGFTVCTSGDVANYGNGGSTNWVENQWGCMAGGGIKTDVNGRVVKDALGGVEAEQGIPYLIMFGSVNPSAGYEPNQQIDLADGVARQALGIYICNHPWPYWGFAQGDGFSRPLDQPGDFFSITAYGVHADGTESSTTYMLAWNGPGGVENLQASDRWEYWDLRALGEVVSIYFRYDGSDQNPPYGINTAAYCCMDRLEMLEPEVLTPVSVRINMNPVSTTMKLRNKATGVEVNVGQPTRPGPGGPGVYNFSTLPGTYTLTGYAQDGSTVNGSIDIEITNEASQTIGIYTATTWATNSGWTLGTDYTIELESLSGSDATVRTSTMGSSNTAGRATFLLLNGDTYVVKLVPSAAKQAAGYMTKTLNGTLNSNGDVSGEITMGGNYNITVPEGVSVFVGTKPKHYVPFVEVQPESVSTSGGKTVYAYSLANNTQYNYRVSQPGKLTHGGIFYMNSDATKRPTLVFTEADMNRVAPTFVDREVSGSKVADIFLNINERHHLRMNVGGEHKMLAQRNWQLVENTINNYFIDPDYHYTVLNANGQPDNSVVRVEDVNGISTVKAVGNGTAIVLVSYDAIYLEQYQRNSALPTAFAAGSLNGAIWPENTGVFVVTVGDQPSGITSNMLINEGRNTTQHKLAGDAVDAEHDVFYYLAPDQGYSYTFKPTGVASVAIAKPTLGANMATYDGFETVQPNADGSYTVLLTHGRSIVRLTNAQGVSDYQVLTAKQAEFTITNLTNNGKPVIPGDQVEILLGGLYHPANKQAGTYNMSAQVEYTSPAGNHTANGGQYSFASTAKKFKLTIPADWDVDASNSFIITDGTIKSGGFGDPYGNHRNVSPSEGRAPNFTANLHPAWFGALPDIRVKVQKTAECQDVMDSYTVNVCGSYEWEGNTYTESGIYTINGQTHCGADHVKTLRLTINQPVTHEFTIDAVGSYTWNGQEYATSGDYVQTFTAANGCDSTVTLHLTVTPAEWTLVGGVAMHSNNSCENTSPLSNGGYFHAIIPQARITWGGGYIHVFSNYEVTWSLEDNNEEVVWEDDNQYWAGNEKTKWCSEARKYGTFVLVATRTDNGEQQRIRIIVEETLSADPIGLSGVSLSETSKQLTVGEQFTLIPVFAPADASNKQVEWSSNNASVATVADGVVTAVGTGSATITVTSKDGGHTATCDVTVAAAVSAPTVYFVHTGGHKQLLDGNNIMELNVLNTGRFYFEGEGCTVLDKWEGREETLQGGWHYWLDQWSDDFTNCRFNPRTTTEGRQITIPYIQNGVTKTLSFTLRVVASAIEEIKAYVGTTELSMDNPYTVQGNERTYITVKGRYANATDWVELPVSSYRIADSDKVHILDNSFSLWMTGEYVLTVEMKDSDLKLDFKVISAFVPLTDFSVLVPATWTIEKWNALNDKYVGISEVDMADKDHGYVLSFAPENASNTELEWESLTPDVAVFDPLHSNGIVPSKAGEARFRVRSVSNPELVREVTVTFVYKHPLLAVSGPSELHLNAGDELDLGAQLAFNPANATEQRLEFTYSASGIVDATCAVEVAGGVGQHTTKHTLTALANGVATLTCTPFDQSAGAEAFDIIVRVGSYTLNYTATNGGSISGAATQNVPHGLSGVEVAAVPEVGFKFLRWSDGRTDNPRIDVNVEENVSVTAEFVPENTTIYTLLYTATEGGSISGAAQQSVVEGQNGIAVTAVPNKGYRFVQWSDGRTEAIRMEENVTSDMTIEAEFIKQIRVDYLAAANGRIDGPATQTVDRGVATEAVTATADEGYRFVRWNDGRTEATRADIIDANIDDTIFVAQFELIRYELTISVVDADAKPLAGAKVTLDGKEFTTDAKGSAIDTLVPGRYAYTVELSGYEPKSGEVVLSADRQEKVELIKTPSTGLRNIERESLSAYPNPTMGELWLTVPEPVEGTVEGAAAEVLVYSINGQLMLRVPMRASAGSAPAAGRIRIDLSGLPAGVYIIRVGNAVAKVVRL
ncbi:MAG: DUF4465 domain-containing protein [Bacteroidales bacterium]|nr:DUF4465 domain-containing protein [Bacteroidales bacterium]